MALCQALSKQTPFGIGADFIVDWRDFGPAIPHYAFDGSYFDSL
jgi:hypothetical protein